MSADHAPSVHISRADLRFAGKRVFQGLNLTLDGGRWTCLLGPSGVGKSSLLRLIAGLTPDGGELHGTVLAGDGQPLADRVAYMAQQDLLLPWASVLDNVLIGPVLRHGKPTDADRGRAVSILERVGLAGEAAALPATLSGGMRQRAALARTFFEDRPIVLMDEPFSALDAITRRRLQDLAVALLRGRTVLLVTHDPLEALRVGDRIVTLSGSPAALGAAVTPSGQAPRSEADPTLWAMHTDLLTRLQNEGGQAA